MTIRDPKKVVENASDLLEFVELGWKAIRAHTTATWSTVLQATMAADYSRMSGEIEAEIGRCRAVHRGDEATRWRQVKMLLDSVVAELRMWLAIKENDADSAWNMFCAAEQYAGLAAMYLDSHKLAREQVEHLKEVERVVFPHQEWFLSSSFLIPESGKVCSVCGMLYAACDHLALEIYDGEVAHVQIKDIQEVLEVSFVNNPSDKRCRVRVFDGIDPLTGERPRSESEPRKALKSKKRKRRR